jgi:class 3 adenylate cyclase
MSVREVVDISEHAQIMRRRRLRRMRRLLIPLACLLVMIAAIVGIAAYSYTQNRRDALALSNTLIKSLDERITAKVAAYLQPVADMVKLAAGTLNITGSTVARSGVEPFAMQVLRTYPQIVAFNVGDPDGNFLMVKKMPDGALDTKTIVRRGNGTQATWIRRDTDGNTRTVERYTDDPYDPRKRPWYTGALQSKGVYWTEVYIFFTDQKPGVTAATVLRGSDGRLRGVLSMDVLLEELSTFLAGLNIGKNGQALIIESDGRLVAMQDMTRMLIHDGEELRPAHMEELDDRVLTRAFNRFRIEGNGIRSLAVDGRHIINIASSLGLMEQRDWTLLIVVPEGDFIGFVKRNAKRGLILSGIVVGLAVVLVSLLIWQGMRADRNAQLIVANRRQFESQSRAFSELANDAGLFESQEPGALGRLTEIVAGTAGVRRVSVWRVDGESDRMLCEDVWDNESSGHTQGTVLSRSEFPDLFAAIQSGEEIVLSDAAADSRTAELHSAYLGPLGSRALLAMPVRLHDKTAGHLWFEGQSAARIWSGDDITFARAVAGLLALRKEIHQFAVCPPPASEASKPAGLSEDAPEFMPDASGPTSPFRAAEPIAGGRNNRFYDRLAARGIARDRLSVDIFPNVTVFVLRFSDHLTMAEQVNQKDRANAMEHLASYIEALASSREFDYLKIMGNEIVGASGFGTDGNHSRIRSAADLALDLEDQCRHVFADLDARMSFCIGMDTGPVLGCVVGTKRDYYNLWGDAVQGAAILSQNGPLGAIHTSESVYAQLRTGYVFKKRGTFYLADTGELRTYLLTGRV